MLLVMDLTPAMYRSSGVHRGFPLNCMMGRACTAMICWVSGYERSNISSVLWRLLTPAPSVEIGTRPSNPTSTASGLADRETVEVAAPIPELKPSNVGPA